jgi:hypothetical protein
MQTEKISEKISFNGGKREGAGRKKGVPNKKTVEIQEKVAETGLTPLEVMLDIMRNTGDDRMRLTAAQAAAPYVHAKLSSVEMTGKDGKELFESVTITLVSANES